MFIHILRNNRLVTRKFVIRGWLNHKVFEVVVEAANSMDAVGLIKAKHPELVITAIHLSKEGME